MLIIPIWYGTKQFTATSNFVNGLNIYLLFHAQALQLNELQYKIWMAAGRNNE